MNCTSVIKCWSAYRGLTLGCYESLIRLNLFDCQRTESNQISFRWQLRRSAENNANSPRELSGACHVLNKNKAELWRTLRPSGSVNEIHSLCFAHDGGDNFFNGTLVTMTHLNRIDNKVAPFFLGSSISSIDLLVNNEAEGVSTQLTKSRMLHISSN